MLGKLTNNNINHLISNMGPPFSAVEALSLKVGLVKYRSQG